MTENFAREWALKWAEGTVLGFARGRVELAGAAGMLRRAEELIGSKKLRAIVDNVERNPIYLPSMSLREKAGKLRPLKERLRWE